MTSPIDRLMNQVTWVTLTGAVQDGEGPYATHQGLLQIGDTVMRVYQLNDGRRVIDGEDVAAFFET